MSSGYTILETLVAFVVMSLVLGVLVPGQGILLRRAAIAEEELLAFEFALSRLARAGVEYPAFPGASETKYRDWIVQETVTLSQVTANLQGYSITISVLDKLGTELAKVQKFAPLG